MSILLEPPRAEMLDTILYRSAHQFDRLILRFMSRAFGATRDGEPDSVVQQRLLEVREFYTRPELLADPRTFHLPPQPHSPQVEELGALEDGRLLEVSFESGFLPRYPEARDSYLDFKENRRIHMWHLAHHTPRPTLMYVHGWGGGMHSIEMRLIPLRAVYQRGYDVAMFTLPFHGARTPRQAWFGGQLFPSQRIDRTNEAFGHAIHDLRVALRHLRGWGGAPVGFMGLSLGGYVSTLLSGLGEEMPFLVLMIPLANLSELLWSHGEGNADRERAERLGMSQELLADLFAVHSPLRLEPRLSPDQVLILAGRGDAICPRRQTELLWHHFQHPQVHWFPGSHVAHFGRGPLAQTLADFVAKRFEREG